MDEKRESVLLLRNRIEDRRDAVGECVEITHFSHRVFCNLSPFAFVGKVVADFGEEVRLALVEDKIFSRDEVVEEILLKI